MPQVVDPRADSAFAAIMKSLDKLESIDIPEDEDPGVEPTAVAPSLRDVPVTASDTNASSDVGDEGSLQPGKLKQKGKSKTKPKVKEPKPKADNTAFVPTRQPANPPPVDKDLLELQEKVAQRRKAQVTQPIHTNGYMAIHDLVSWLPTPGDTGVPYAVLKARLRKQAFSLGLHPSEECGDDDVIIGALTQAGWYSANRMWYAPPGTRQQTMKGSSAPAINPNGQLSKFWKHGQARYKGDTTLYI